MSLPPHIQEFIWLALELDQNYDDNDDDRAMTEELLTHFIPAIIMKKDFSVSLEDLADWLNVGQVSLKRVLLEDFVEGRDYIVKVAAVTRTPETEQIRTYFITMDDMYRDHALPQIEMRPLFEDPEITKIKRSGPLLRRK